jgi:hypothetical protein
MEKSSYQEAAMNHVMEYMDRLLRMETMVGKNMEKKKGNKE